MPHLTFLQIFLFPSFSPDYLRSVGLCLTPPISPGSGKEEKCERSGRKKMKREEDGRMELEAETGSKVLVNEFGDVLDIYFLILFPASTESLLLSLSLTLLSLSLRLSSQYVATWATDGTGNRMMTPSNVSRNTSLRTYPQPVRYQEKTRSFDYSDHGYSECCFPLDSRASFDSDCGFSSRRNCAI